MFVLQKNDILNALTINKIVNESSMLDSYPELSIDTRTLSRGAIYLAIKGNRFDGHEFLNAALKSGANLLIVDRVSEELCTDKTIIVVDDTLAAYEDLAKAIRAKLNFKVFAITGSYAKTTTKDILAHILSKRGSCLKSIGTENNNIGLPKTLAKARYTDKFAVLELGTNHFGEIEHLSRIAQPDCVVLTGISQAHTEFLGDVNGVLKEKSSVFKVCPQAKAIINGDDKLLRETDIAKNAIWFGASKDCDVYWEIVSETDSAIELLINRKYNLRLKTKALFNANNVCAAIAAASYGGIDIKTAVKALDDFVFPSMRFEIVEKQGVTFVNDAYNANPYAFKQSLKSLKRFEHKRKILVLADMAELGDENIKAHESIANDIVDLNADYVLFIGGNMKYAYDALPDSIVDKEYFTDKKNLECTLKDIVQKGDIVFLKGSRVFALETLLASFKI